MLIGNDTIGNRKIGNTRFETLSPLSMSVYDNVTKQEVSNLPSITATASDNITKQEISVLPVITGIANDIITRVERYYASLNGNPISLLWSKVSKVSTIWTKTPKP